ncbi:unnamed protein product [Arctogadus glacialis]
MSTTEDGRMDTLGAVLSDSRGHWRPARNPGPLQPLIIQRRSHAPSRLSCTQRGLSIPCQTAAPGLPPWPRDYPRSPRVGAPTQPGLRHTNMRHSLTANEFDARAGPLAASPPAVARNAIAAVAPGRLRPTPAPRSNLELE